MGSGGDIYTGLAGGSLVLAGGFSTGGSVAESTGGPLRLGSLWSAGGSLRLTGGSLTRSTGAESTGGPLRLGSLWSAEGSLRLTGGSLRLAVGSITRSTGAESTGGTLGLAEASLGPAWRLTGVSIATGGSLGPALTGGPVITASVERGLSLQPR